MTTPNLTAQADVALDPLAGTLQTGRIAYSPDFESNPQERRERLLRSLDDLPPVDPARLAQMAADAAAVRLTLPYPISANRYWASRTVTPKGKPSFTTPT